MWQRWDLNGALKMVVEYTLKMIHGSGEDCISNGLSMVKPDSVRCQTEVAFQNLESVAYTALILFIFG